MVWLVLSYYHCNQSGICKRFEITASEDSVLLELVELLTTPPSFSSTPPHPRASHPPFLRTHVLLSRTYIHIHNEAHTLSTQTHKTVHTQTHSHTLMFVCQAVCLFYLPTYPPPTPHLPPLLSTPNPLHVLVVLVVGCMEKAASKSFFSTR